MLMKCARRIVQDYLAENDVVIICDKPHKELAAAIKVAYGSGLAAAECLLAVDKAACDQAFTYCQKQGKSTLVLFEPRSYGEFQVHSRLDFSGGLPKISGLAQPSYISVFPIASALRIYSSDSAADARAKHNLLGLLKPHSDYEIRTNQGTRLFFTARAWLEQGNEVLTAPVEDSINGQIAVDGALFFKKVDAILDFFIEAGELVAIQARERQHNDLVLAYRQMTNVDFAVRRNRQLAEIGFGCNTGAAISDCFMESEMVYGTVHYCFGNNACYGGNNKSDFHGGSVLVKQPHIRQL